jgi:hypothetical protein
VCVHARAHGIGQGRESLNMSNAPDLYLGGLRLSIVILSPSKQVSELVSDHFFFSNNSTSLLIIILPFGPIYTI